MTTKDEISSYFKSYKITKDKIEPLFSLASTLALNTPLSFRKQIIATMNHSQHYELWLKHYALHSQLCHISPLDMQEDIVCNHQRPKKTLFCDFDYLF